MNWLLSDEFVTFSQKVAEIHAQKKKLKIDLKEYYDRISSQIKSLDKEATVLSDEFESWKTEHAGKEKVEKTDAEE
jgi:iron-sulfur cluster repair protein YtfE (RIC family)